LSEGAKKLVANGIPGLSLHEDNQKSIWAVGGGKGGTGKSFFSASLAIQLVSKEKEVVLIDADLGGPNLHTFLGVRESQRDLGHFITNKVTSLKDTLSFTSFDGLKLVRRTDNVLFMSNLNYYKKLKLMRHIKAFDAKRVIIDIGTGSSYNNVDLFLLSNPGILIINPEPTSIENAYYFIKSCIIRLLKLYIDHYKIQDLIKRIATQIQDTSRSIYSFLSEIISHDKFYADLLYRALQQFQPCLVINKARDEKDFLLGKSIVNVVQKYLVIDLNFLGVIPFDEKVHLSLKNFTPYMRQFPQGEAASSIRYITDKLVGLSNIGKPE